MDDEEGREKFIDKCDRCTASALYWHFSPCQQKPEAVDHEMFQSEHALKAPAPRGGRNKNTGKSRRVKVLFKNTSSIRTEVNYTRTFVKRTRRFRQTAQIWHKLSEAVKPQI